MKKLITLSLGIFCAALFLLSGCSGQSADEYAGETITSLKEGDERRGVGVRHT